MWNNETNGQNQSSNNNRTQFNSKNQSKISPLEIAVVTALLTNSIYVQSILIDREQIVQVLLEGSLQNPQDLSKFMDQMKDVPVGDLFSSMLNRK